MTEGDYLHGFTTDEQDRLVEQARVLAPAVYQAIALPADARSLVEIGCGVGAQTMLLRERFPAVTVTAVDREPRQLARAAELLADAVRLGHVRLVHGDAAALPFGDGTFPAAFICWLLEHVADPAAVLAEARRVLAPGGVLWCTEVFNASVHTRPVMPALVDWWRRFADLQRRLGGDPDLGARLGGLLDAAGFRDVALTPLIFCCDRRTRDAGQRRRFFGYWRDLLLSAVPLMARHGEPTDVAALTAALAALESDTESVFLAQAIQARAVH